MITFFEKFLSRKTINTWLPLSICGTCCCLDSPLSGLICHIRPSSLYGSKSKSEKAKESWKADGSTKPDSRLDKLDKCRLKWSATWLIASVFLSLFFFFPYFWFLFSLLGKFSSDGGIQKKKKSKITKQKKNEINWPIFRWGERVESQFYWARIGHARTSEIPSIFALSSGWSGLLYIVVFSI